MADWINWLVAAGVLVVLELFTGTFYLLMIAIGLGFGALAALGGMSGAVQTIVAAVVGVRGHRAAAPQPLRPAGARQRGARPERQHRHRPAPARSTNGMAARRA